MFTMDIHVQSYLMKDGTCLRKRDRDPLLTILVEPHDTHIGMEDYNPC